MRGESTAAPAPGAVGENDLVGSLRVAGLFDLCQFLLLGARTGTLAIHRDGGTTKLHFVDGQIVNAAEDPEGVQGRDVALRALRISRGTFRFRAEETSPARLIEEGTQNLLLDAARSLDEMEAEEGERRSNGGVSREEELVEKRAKAESLRNLFSKIEREVAGRGEAPPLDSLLDVLAARGGELLYLREGFPPLIVNGGRVVDRVPGTAGDDIFRELRLRLEGSYAVEHAAGRFRPVEGFSDGAVALRRIEPARPLDDWNLDPAKVNEIFGAGRGIVLVTAEPTRILTSLFASVAAHLASSGLTGLQIGGDPPPADGATLTAHRPRPANRESRRSLLSQAASFRPSVVFLPELRGGEDAALALDLARTGLMVAAALPGRSGADAFHRAAGWFREGGTLRGAAALLSGIIAFRLAAEDAGAGPSQASAAAWPAEARRLLAEEDFAALETALP